MRFAKKLGIFCAIWIGVSTCAWAQFMHHGGAHPPQMPNLFMPVVGSGAQYQFTSQKSTAEFEYAVVGKEQVEGKEGYWLEIRIQNDKMKGEMVMKELTVLNGSHPEIKRMISQPPGRPPMEMPAGMIGMMERHSPSGQSVANNGMGEKIGEESISVPAGTFDCEHYRKQEEGKPVDLWISTKVSPYGVVKMVREDASMVLIKVLTNETSHIKGEPQKMDFPHF